MPPEKKHQDFQIIWEHQQAKDKKICINRRGARNKSPSLRKRKSLDTKQPNENKP
jgi:hypothetical protein